jgi:hypothetical protein
MVTAISRMTVGCEDGFAVGTFTFDETVKDEDFVDMMLGRVKDLPVERIAMRENRFRMPGPQVTPHNPARLSVVATPHETCQVIVGAADCGAELTLEGELYTPGIPDLPEELFRFRVQTRLMEVVMHPKGASTVKLSSDADEQLDIETIAQTSTVELGEFRRMEFWHLGSR